MEIKDNNIVSDLNASRNSQKLSIVETIKKPTLRHNPDDRKKLTLLLAKAYACQKIYGDKIDMLNMREEMFQELLADFEYEKVELAFYEYLRSRPDIPAPADIINIIKSKKWGVITL